MTKYETFIVDHTPSGVVVTLQALKSACEKAGLAFSLSGGKAKISREESFFSWEVKGDFVTLHYSFEGIGEGRSALYRADLHASTYRGSVNREVRDAVVPNFAPQVTVPLPERVVDLPIPSWTTEAASNDGLGWVHSCRMFESEAREALNSFNRQVAEALA